MKILIVGAGPVGCYTAQLLKNMGYHPVLIEEHLTLGQPIHCSGIVSSDLLTLVESYLSDDAVISRINGFSINTPWEEEFSIKKDGVAVLLDRERFDSCLGRGLEINLGERVSTIIEKKD
ncbi:FAD-dependent monooxygenase, partial [bacterium]|nr:FAD-dependent monooxygenase [bacterium]